MNDQTPVCPVHKQPMKPSKFGGWYCTRRHEGDWCKWRAGDNGKPYESGPKPTVVFDKARYYGRKYGW